MQKKKSSPISFEAALQELEQIVSRLEAGDLPLEQALSEFERGIKLARESQAQLQQAEQRVQILLKDNQTPAPFDPQKNNPPDTSES